MRKIRIGNDIAVQWSLVAKGTGEPFVVEGKDIRLSLKSIFAKTSINEFDVAGNTISWTFKGAEQKQVGIYSLEVSLLDEQGVMITTDVCDFVELVACSCEIGGMDATGVHTESIELVSDVDVAAGIDLSKYLTKTEAQTTYQPQEKGKGLSTNDYTTAEKNKLAGLQNYDDAEVQNKLTELSAETTELSERISENELLIEDLQNTKIDKEADDYYPQLSVGVADNLAGVDVVASDFGFRRSGGGAISDGVARVESIKGNSVVWNQLFSMYITSLISNGVKVTNNADNSITANGTLSTTFFNVGYFKSNIENHLYLFMLVGGKTLEGKNFSLLNRNVYADISSGFAYIFYKNTDASLNKYIGISKLQVDEVVNDTFYIRQIDLTQMFGAGNEPTTIEDFYQRIPQGIDLNSYNEGEIIDMRAEGIKSVGRNAWDEQWENGTFDTTTGENITKEGQIRSKNLIKVLPNTSYYVKVDNTSGMWVMFLNDKQEVIAPPTFGGNRSGNCINVKSIVPSFKTPTNASYLRFYCTDDYGNTYNHDICINLSDTEINGKYFPYTENAEDLSFIKDIFPNGMRSAGTAHDEIRYNKQTNKWEAVQRISEDREILAEPIVTEITADIVENPDFNLDYLVQNCGTEQMIANEPSSAIKADITYGFNAVGLIKQQKAEIAALKAALAKAGITLDL